MKIEDAFHDLPISRQRKYQLRKRAQGKCVTCGGPSKRFSRCRECFRVLHAQKGCTRWNSTSPRIKASQEAKAKREQPKSREPRENPWLIKGE